MEKEIKEVKQHQEYNVLKTKVNGIGKSFKKTWTRRITAEKC